MIPIPACSTRRSPLARALVARALFAQRAWLLLAVSCLRGSLAQDPVKAFPQNYSLAFENSVVAVVRVHYGAHETVGVHDHPPVPTVFVYLSDAGAVRFSHEAADATALTRPPTFKGAFRVSPGQRERHGVENLGDSASDFLRVELKQVPLGRLQPLRVKPPQNLAETQSLVEYQSPEMEIDRVLCAGPSACPLKPSEAPSLLIAFSTFSALTTVPKQQQTIAGGTVRWVQPGEALQLLPIPGSPAHLLRISLPPLKD